MTSKIPKIVHYTFATNKLPAEIIANIENNKKMCPDYKFIFYNDLDCDLFIKTNFDERTYNAYNKINPIYGAMKADFFRYCVLFIEGGVYIDIKSTINVNLSDIIKPDDGCILDIRRVLEPWRKFNPTFEQWLLIFKPGHPYLKCMIELMVKHIYTKFIPSFINKSIRMTAKQMILNITGPDAFTRAVVNVMRRFNRRFHRNIDYNKYFTYCKFKNYKQMYTMNNKKHYSEGVAPLYI